VSFQFRLRYRNQFGFGLRQQVIAKNLADSHLARSTTSVQAFDSIGLRIGALAGPMDAVTSPWAFGDSALTASAIHVAAFGCPTTSASKMAHIAPKPTKTQNRSIHHSKMTCALHGKTCFENTAAERTCVWCTSHLSIKCV
jgi:hypothetical protein